MKKARHEKRINFETTISLKDLQMPPDNSRTSQIIEEARRNRESREKSYRGRALQLFPWICARCGREFEGKRLRELTGHTWAEVAGGFACGVGGWLVGRSLTG